MAELGVAFRQNDGYVTDGANDEWIEYDFFAGGNYPTTLSTGLVCGWQASSNGSEGRDRSTSIDVRLAGLQFNRTSTEQLLFRIDLPSGAGAYNVRAAFGDNAYGPGDAYFELRDNATAFKTIDHSGGNSAAQWYDANDVLRTSAADWASNNVRVNRTFSSSIFRLAMGRGGAATGSCVVSYLSVESAGGGGGGTILPQMMAHHA